MPQAVSIRCPQCNAALSINPAARETRCEYCGTPVLVKHTQAPMPRTDVPAPRQRPVPPQAQGGGRVSRWLIAAPLLLTIMGGAMSAVVTMRATTVGSETVTSSAVPGVPGVAAPTERLSWDMTTSMATVRLNSDAIDDLLVFVAVYAGSENPLHLAAIDGASGERLWMTESYGTISTHNAHVHTELAVQGNLVLVTDHRRTAHVLDLTTGSELRTATLTDRAEWVCADPESDSHVWIEVADDQHVRMDLTTAALTPAPKRPEYCPPWHERVDCRDYKGSVRCARDTDRMKLDGFYAEGVLSMGAERVAVGYKSPGTRLPMAAAYRKGVKKPHWMRRLIEDQDAPVQEGAPGHYDVAGGRLVMHYEVGNEEHRLMALDIATGKTLWDLVLPRNGDRERDVRAVIASETRVFVLDYEELLRVDAATGQILNQPVH